MIPLACPKSSGDSCCISGWRLECEFLLTLWILRDLQEMLVWPGVEARARALADAPEQHRTSYVVVLQIELNMKRKDIAKLPGAGRRRKRQSELPGQAGKLFESSELCYPSP